MQIPTLKTLFTWKAITFFIITLFCIRYIPLETRAGPSIIKISVSALCIGLLILYPPKISKALLGGGIYFLWVYITASFHYQTFRWSTILYLLSFLIVFIFYYNQVFFEHRITFDEFILFLKSMIMAFFILLAIQQILILSGVKEMPLLNFVQYLNRGLGANSLSGEPSSAGRIIATLYLGLIRMREIEYNRKVTINDLWKKDKWTSCCFIWSMTTMGSGTAFIALLILCLYFIQYRYLVTFIPLIVIFFLIIPYIDLEPLQRAYNIIFSFLSGDPDKVIQTDHSAASRVTGLMNMFTIVDYSNFETWIGHGCDYSASFGNYTARLKTNLIGGINEYGLISFIIMQTIVYRCIIRSFFSIETLFWIFLFSLTFSNISYVWGCLMIFTTVRYFQELNEEGALIQSENSEY